MAGKAVVVTGASSGLGRAAAVQLAKKGARVVLAARREAPLRETEALCRAHSVPTVLVVADVTKEADVQRIADEALEKLGALDVWVNNAGVTAFAILDDSPFDVHRRVIETNVIGAMLGARVCIPIFKRQGRGILVNVASVLAKVAQPYVPSYVVSKFALRGLSEALSVELSERDDIHVCTLFPYAFASPHFESGANLIGRGAHPIAPTQSTEIVARALVSLVEDPRRELYVPRYIALGVWLHGLLPRAVDRAVHAVVREWHFGHERDHKRSGNLFRSSSSAPAPARARGTREARGTLLDIGIWAVKRMLGGERVSRESPGPDPAV